MNLAKMCAVVMKSNIDASVLITSLSATVVLRQSSTKLEWVRTHPLGRPVEPDV